MTTVSRLYGRGWLAGHLTFSIQTRYNVKLGTEVVVMHIKSTLHRYQVDDVTLTSWTTLKKPRQAKRDDDVGIVTQKVIGSKFFTLSHILSHKLC